MASSEINASGTEPANNDTGIQSGVTCDSFINGKRFSSEFRPAVPHLPVALVNRVLHRKKNQTLSSIQKTVILCNCYIRDTSVAHQH